MLDDAMLWDEILKAIVSVMPEQLFPLFKEVFGKEYVKGSDIRLLSTEYSTYTENPNAPPGSRLTDITLAVNGTDYYHLECQMKNDGSMVIRMVAYDLHIAMQHGTAREEGAGEIVMRFPYSAVIYPEKNDNIPDVLRCRLIFCDGSEHIYQIPAVHIQAFSLSEILEKHLELFIPYTLLRLRPKLKSRQSLTKEELTDFVEEVIVILQKELRDGYLTEQQFRDYLHLFRDAAGRVFARCQEFWEEVNRMTKPLIELPSVREKRMLEQLAAEIAEKAEKLTRMGAELSQRDAELSQRNAELTQRDAELTQRDAELAKKNEEINGKDEEIASLKAELARLKTSLSMLLW